jgi:hypothetical protein
MFVESGAISRIWNARVRYLKVTALRLWEASRLSFGRLLPGKPPNISTVSSVLFGPGLYYYDIVS